MPSGTGMDLFGKKFPNRMFDVGTAEQHAVTFAGGLATEGYNPINGKQGFVKLRYVFPSICCRQLETANFRNYVLNSIDKLVETKEGNNPMMEVGEFSTCDEYFRLIKKSTEDQLLQVQPIPPF